MKWAQGTIVLAAAVLAAVATVWATKPDGNLGFLPPSVSLRLFAGETGSYEIKLHNGLGRDTTVHIKANVTQQPQGGLRAHVVLGFPETVFAKTGNTIIRVTVTVNMKAVPGLYVLSNWVL